MDREFGRFILDKTGSIIVAKCATLLSYQLSEGHTCIDLKSIAGNLFTTTDSSDEIIFPALEVLHSSLHESSWVGGAQQKKPLILDGGRLYLQKYYAYESIVAEAVRCKCALPPIPLSEKELQLAQMLFHTPDPGDLSNFGGHLQLAAGMIPFYSGFSVISGGPGTGKTTVLAKVLALILERQRELKIGLVAPTGKAAMRMNESLQKALSSLPFDSDVKEILADLEALTIHRLLGTNKLSPHFKHNRKEPLRHDLLVVDEASMVDMALMAKLLDATKSECRIILLGDMNQLSSVEAGSVLGDLCSAFGVNRFTSGFAETHRKIVKDPNNSVESSGDIFSPVVHLRRSYRFGPESGIGNISRAIIEQTDVLTQWEKNKSDCTLQLCEKSSDFIDSEITTCYKPLHAAVSPKEALDILDRFKVLTAMRSGSVGCDTVNTAVRSFFHKGGDPWYENMPIMIRENSYSLSLFNGDTGVIAKDEKGSLKAYFRGEEGLRSFIPALLPSFSLAYAITVHKSQGSEFDEVLTLLPGKESAILTKELIYTAITRAKKNAITVIESKDLLSGWLERRVTRGSGLQDKL